MSAGEPIGVSWTDGPANRWDWLAVYKAGASDPNTDSYTDLGVHGAARLRHGAAEHRRLGDSGPGHAGRAVAAAARASTWCTTCSDQYKSAGSARFTVTDGG